MGKYIKALENLSVEPYNFTAEIKNDSVTEAIDVARQKTGDSIGIGIIVLIWASIYLHITKQENAFNLSHIQALVSVNSIIFAFALLFLYLGIMASTQYFVWTVLAIYLSQVIGILRSTT